MLPKRQGMTAAIDLILLFVGLSALIFGAHLIVNQAIIIARHFQLNDVLVGVAILSVGSDLPEIVISLNASMHQLQQEDTSGLIMGNALGSNFSQLGLIMGIVGLFGYLTLGKRMVYKHGGVLLGSILYLLIAALDNQVTRIEGLILVLAFVVYITMLFGQESREEKQPEKVTTNMLIVWLLLVVGLILTIGGSEVTVRSTVSLAEYLGVSQSLIAIVILGIGSSLPELTISLGAILKSRAGMSVGNLMGSNIIDTMLPVGLAAIIHPVTVEPGLVMVDIPLLFVLSFMVLLFLLKRKGLQKPEALVLILFYAGYLGYKFLGS